MANDNLSTNYINKLNEIIGFFEKEKEFGLHYILMAKEDSKFFNTYFLSVLLIIITIINILSTKNIFSNYYISWAILIVLLLVAIIIIGDFYISHRKTKKYIDKSIRFNLIINYLVSLKTIEHDVDLLPLIRTIKKRYHIRTDFALLNEERYLYDIWYEEIYNCLDTISKEIKDKENLRFKGRILTKKN